MVLECKIGRYLCEPCISYDGKVGNKLLPGETLRIVMGDDKLSFIILNKKIYSSIELNINKE